MDNAKITINDIDLLIVASVSAELDFPSVGPQHCYLQAIGRAQYVGATDVQALEAFMLLSLEEGIIPALESSHALAYAIRLAKQNPEREQKFIVNLSGRGDKDIFQVYERFEKEGIMSDGHLTRQSLKVFQEKHGLAWKKRAVICDRPDNDWILFFGSVFQLVWPLQNAVHVVDVFVTGGY